MDQVYSYISAAIVAIVTLSVPAGLLGSVIEAFGKHFKLPGVETFGDKLEKFFFDLPGLLGKGK